MSHEARRSSEECVGSHESHRPNYEPPRFLPSTARSMMVGRFFLVLAGACQFGHGPGGFAANFIHPRTATIRHGLKRDRLMEVYLRLKRPCTGHPTTVRHADSCLGTASAWWTTLTPTVGFSALSLILHV